ncbi:membrane-bound PQQ-dependent dehydrogenase, glucose/quinate/shikimate family [Novosphingobium sp. KA1]|uniref:membrane-bound PQQ-dependent dehydrogenase, glucose/quinate/shikimate family n=1 Tax=Novosphingobium sp. (strain KA1) TaxID=164608 RepID=UPI001A90A3FF|nr:membrane-bound PQQ-dependent dehydrogenase, glucose/quinate/shikimate family [Novosphingobium sp. KA1]QSR19526.1 membrane-bound PQQ-dependent dehydrogenase, glucose/quinate/shikimate family [Novosphingobium sp. KA1]
MSKIARLYAVVLLIIGAALTAGGLWLAALGGTPYYAIFGATLALAAVLALRNHRQANWVLVFALAGTVIWSLFEAGLRFWDLFPRLLAPIALVGLGLGLFPSIVSGNARRGFRLGAAACAIAFAAMFGLAFVPHPTVSAVAAADYSPGAGDNAPQDWTSYGASTAGLRYATYNKINRDNVATLKPAWTIRTGDMGPGIDQNTPLQIGDTLYSCTRNNVILALDPDTGATRWRFDPHAKAPFWQRCRSLGYYQSTTASGECQQRLIATTIDARLMALDARTGKLCPGFGNDGTVSLAEGMGPVKPGFYFQTSAPLVARNIIVIGGWVVDNEQTGEPSGVIRGFDVITGKLVWAWDLGNPAITREPPPGQTYTRGTPNMWTTAAYDDKLGLIYVPLGNATPDYYGVQRKPWADRYNSTLVALDVTSGRERWKFQTVHHDLWDYDLPAQPALVNLRGNIPALLLSTKRGQLFLLNRATGQPLSRVVEKPVSSAGSMPGERMSPTQPYSVDMPVIAETLNERRMWGMTMFDQLACRISFRQSRYSGDFTPPGMAQSIEHPSNLGGLNWGSMSVDVPNNRVFMNDVRVPMTVRLMTRPEFTEFAKKNHPDGTGHGPSPQLGTPYGVNIQMWMTKLGVPCSRPPFGTITAVDLNTRKIAWQVPAGTAEELGPLGIKSHLPMPIGMPTYAGTSVTAGGLLFFAGSQDYYLRAYDTSDGKEVWRYRLPVGSSATPMTYISPKTGRQYVLVSVGGAAHSKDVGDYVIAFSIPQSK